LNFQQKIVFIGKQQQQGEMGGEHQVLY